MTDQSWYDCTWRRYTPFLPIFLTTLFDQGDKAFDYSPWACNDYAQLDTPETFDENGNSLETPVEFTEDLGGDDLEEEPVVWEYDPSNVVVE